MTLNMCWHFDQHNICLQAFFSVWICLSYKFLDTGTYHAAERYVYHEVTYIKEWVVTGSSNLLHQWNKHRSESLTAVYFALDTAISLLWVSVFHQKYPLQIRLGIPLWLEEQPSNFKSVSYLAFLTLFWGVLASYPPLNVWLKCLW